jgi:hypothetical protein
MSMTKSQPAFERLMEENRQRENNSFEEYKDEQYWAERERQERESLLPSQQKQNTQTSTLKNNNENGTRNI